MTDNDIYLVVRIRSEVPTRRGYALRQIREAVSQFEFGPVETVQVSHVPIHPDRQNFYGETSAMGQARYGAARRGCQEVGRYIDRALEARDRKERGAGSAAASILAGTRNTQTVLVPCRDYDPPNLWCSPCRRGDVNKCQDPRQREVPV